MVTLQSVFALLGTTVEQLFELVDMVPAVAPDTALCPGAGCIVCSKL
jgi:hypothetical protein